MTKEQKWRLIPTSHTPDQRYGSRLLIGHHLFVLGGWAEGTERGAGPGMSMIDLSSSLNDTALSTRFAATTLSSLIREVKVDQEDVIHDGALATVYKGTRKPSHEEEGVQVKYSSCGYMQHYF